MNNEIIIYITLATGVLIVLFSSLAKVGTGFGDFLASMRKVGSDSKDADLSSKEKIIAVLTKDLDTERERAASDRTRFAAELALVREQAAKDRQGFFDELARRDESAMIHLKWDWRVYSLLYHSGNVVDPPPPLVPGVSFDPLEDARNTDQISDSED